jgi:hypothetical protein
MNEGEVTEGAVSCNDVTLTGEALEILKREHCAAIDALRFDLEVLRRCLLQGHPECVTHLTRRKPDDARERLSWRKVAPNRTGT